MKKFISLILCLIMCCIPLCSTVTATEADPYDSIIASAYDYTNDSSTRIAGAYVAMPRTLASYIKFEGIEFTDAPYAIVVQNGIDETYNSDNIFEIRIDSPSSEPISTVYCTELGGWNTPVDNTGTITKTITGVHDVYISTNRPNNFFSFYFLAIRKDGEKYIPYSSEGTFWDLDGSKFKNAVEILNGLNIINDVEGEFISEFPITRASFAKWISGIYTEEMPESNSQYFDDVLSTEENINEVNYLFEQGILKQNEAKLYNPWGFISATDAAVMLLRILGYEKLAEYRGGYPDGYRRVAAELGFFSGVSPYDYMRRGTAAEMILKAIEAKYLKPGSVSNGEMKYEPTTGILSYTRNIYNGNGLVTANQYTSLYFSETLPSGRCCIGNEIYLAGESKAASYIGLNCNFYYKKDKSTGEKTIYYILPSTRTKQIILSTTEVKFGKITASEITYSKNNKTVSKKINTSANFIYNNKTASQSQINSIKTSDFRGTVRLIDNGNGYETVILENYRNIKILSVDTENQIFYDEIKGEKVSYGDKKSFFSDASGTEVNMKKLPKNSYGLAYISENITGEKMMVVEIGINVVRGTVTEISDNKIYIDGQAFFESAEKYKSINVGVTADYYINKYNEIVDYIEVAADKQIAIFSDITKVGNTVTIKLITNTDTVNEYETAEIFCIDGVKVADFDEMMDGVKTFDGLKSITRYTPVLYALNDENKIKMLDTPLKGSGNQNDTLTQLNSDNSKPYYYYGGLKAFINNSAFEMPYPFNGNARLIVLNTLNGSVNCKFGNLEAGSYSSYPYFYSTVQNSEFVDIVYIKDQSSYKTANEYMIVDSITKEINSNGDVGITLHGYQKSSKVNYWISESNTALVNNVQSLKCGDVIRVETDVSGNLVTFSVGCFSDGSLTNSAGLAPAVNKNSGVSGAYTVKNNFILGNVEKIEKGYIKIKAFGSNSPYWISVTGVNVNAVEQEGAENYLKINAGEMNISIDDTVLVWLRESSINQITVFRTDAFTEGGQ